MTRLALVGLGAGAGFLPLLLVHHFEIWAPLATVQEAFSFYYAHGRILKHGFQFVYTGHFAFPFLAYPATWMTEWLWGDASDFVKQQRWTDVFYSVKGAMVTGVFAWMYRQRTPTYCLALLLAVPLALPMLERGLSYDLHVNYSHFLEILFLVLTAVVMLRLRDEISWSRPLAVMMGALAALGFGTKFSVLIVFLPLTIFVALPPALSRRSLRAALLCYSAGFAGTGAMTLVAYMQFRMRYLPEIIRHLRELYASGFASQQTPFFFDNLFLPFRLDGHYFGVQLFFLAWLAATAGVVTVAIRRKKIDLWLLVAGDAVLAALYWAMVQTRASIGTMIDIVLFLAMSLVLKCVVIAASSKAERRVGVFCFAIICVIFLSSLTSFGRYPLLRRLAENTIIARDLAAFVDARPDLPIVYYMSGLPQPLLFPNPGLLILQGASSVPTFGSSYLARHHPRLRSVSPTEGVVGYPHIAVVPQYLDDWPASTYTERQWPERWGRYAVLDSSPKLREGLAGEFCQVYQFAEVQPRAEPLYYWSYPTQVTACLLKR